MTRKEQKGVRKNKAKILGSNLILSSSSRSTKSKQTGNCFQAPEISEKITKINVHRSSHFLIIFKFYLYLVAIVERQ